MDKPQPIKVVLTGGGTGGHITPLLAVAHKLKEHDPHTHISYIGERNSKFSEMAKTALFDDSFHIFAGKFRRYNGESFLKRLFDVKTNLLNIRDLFYVIFGFFGSLRLLRKIKPDVILLKGGFVGLPVGLAAALLRIPFVTHDSDALPGLANRLVARWAHYHATGMPASFYSYPAESVRYTGVLVTEGYQKVSPEAKKAFRRELSIPSGSKVLFVTGGSHGSQVINKAIVESLPALRQAVPELYVVHQTGKGNEAIYDGREGEEKAGLDVQPLLKDMYRYSGAADVIVTRAGANTLAEFGVQGKACIVVPNPLLTGGHQLINARELSDQEAVVVVQEDNLTETLQKEIVRLLTDSAAAQRLAEKLNKLTKANATDELTSLIVDVATESGSGK